MKYFYVEAQDYYFIVVEDEEFHVFVENNSCEFPHREDETDAEFKMRCEEWLRNVADDLDTSGAAWGTFPLIAKEIVFDDAEIIAEVEL